MYNIYRYILALFFLTFVHNVQASTGEEMHKNIENIDRFMYYQQFYDAFQSWEDMIHKYSLEAIAQELSYKDFMQFMGLSLAHLNNSNETTDYRVYYNLLDLRRKFFPKQALRSHFRFYENRIQFFLKCRDNSNILSDKVFYYYCVLESKDISTTVKKEIWKDFEKISQRYKYSRSLIDIGFIGYMYQIYLDKFPERKGNIQPILENLGNRMISLDKHWMNWYSILWSSYASGSIQYQRNLSNAQLNYIGDTDRLNMILNEIAAQSY